MPTSVPTLSPIVFPSASDTVTATNIPTHTPSPFPDTPTPTLSLTPSASATSTIQGDLFPTELQLPPAEIEILSPADGARLLSPVQIRANMFPGPEGRLRVELVGEDGRSLARHVLVWTLVDNVKQIIRTELEFEIDGVAEAGRLMVSVDDEYGRLKAISSVDVILLTEGLRESSFSLDTQEKIHLLAPQADDVVESGIIEIRGIARPQSERPLNVQIIARDGRVLAFGEAYVTFPEGFEYGVFSIFLEAQVSVRQWVQIAVRETGDRIPGDVHFSSIEVILTP